MTELADYFHRASREAAIEIHYVFGLNTGMLLSILDRHFRVVVAGTIEINSPLALSVELMVDLVVIRTVQ